MNLLDYLSEQEKSKATKIGFSKGEFIRKEGEECRGVYFLARGQIKIVTYTLKGKEIVYNRFVGSGMFGNNLCYSEDNRFRGNVVGELDGTLYYLPREFMTEVLQSNKEFLEAYLSEVASFGRALNGRIQVLSIPSAAERFEFYLMSRGGRIQFKTVASLADELHLSREVLSRTIHEMERRGTIKIQNHTILVLG